MTKRTRAPKTGSEVRQEQIVSASLDLVGRNGLKALTVAAIAQEVGVVPSGIYRHFKGKNEVIGAMVELIGRRLLGNVEATCHDTGDAEERLRLLHIRHVGLIRQSKGIPRLIFSEDVYNDDIAGKRRLYDVIQAYRNRVADIVREGQQAGTLRDDVKPEAVSLMFLGLIQPAAILSHISNGAFDITAETEQCWRLFSRAIQSNRTAPVTEVHGGSAARGNSKTEQHPSQKGNSR